MNAGPSATSMEQPASRHSTESSTALAARKASSDDATAPPARPSSTYSAATTVAASPSLAADPSQPQHDTPPRYLYRERKGPPNPDIQPKPKSKMSRFLSKFQSPAVKGTVAAREREKLEEERTGVRVYTPVGTASGSLQTTVAYM